ncbi:MAG: sigma 54-interacting transcriptional regulator [Eubacteriales bacterium]|nr:sigma 54-interacting transcriptional regulator [Eubacteriales bacterium]
MKNTFGINRVLEPKGAVPVTAWKLDNSKSIRQNEARVKLERIHLERNSFQQICSQCEFDETKIKERIIDIVNRRGKLHNPFTNSGGMLYGRFEEIGPEYSKQHNYNVDDEFMCLVTITAIPMYIEEIKSVDYNYGQIEVAGYAIVFLDTTAYKDVIDSDIKYTMAALEEAGSLFNISKVAKDAKRVTIIGKDIISSMLYGGVVRKSVGKDCDILIILDYDSYGNLPEKDVSKILCNYADKVEFMDVRNPSEIYSRFNNYVSKMDLVINCENKLGTETISVFLCKNNGTIYFTSMTNGYATAILIAESMRKQVFAFALDQYFEGYDGFTATIIKATKNQLDKVSQLYLKNSAYKEISQRTAKMLSLYKASQIDDFIYSSPVTEEMIENVLNISKYDCNVIIQGETGVGKEKVLQLIHKNSSRNDKPCIKVNCATIQENLGESEFFGYEGGAFTGAQSKGKKGYFELANNGILFLDEIGSLSLNMQSKLLRVLQENQFYRVGGTVQLSVNVRVICANNVSLKNLVEEGKFREDLYYRLNICTINVPALRNRKEDILCLSKEFLKKYNKRYGVNKEISEEAIGILQTYDWPGNVRELENTIHRMVINIKENLIDRYDVNMILNENVYDANILDVKGKFRRDGIINFDAVIEEQEKKLIQYALSKEGTTRKAAEALGITQAKLMRRKQKYDI